MNKNELIEYCKQYLTVLTLEQLREIKNQIEANINKYEDDY